MLWLLEPISHPNGPFLGQEQVVHVFGQLRLELADLHRLRHERNGVFEECPAHRHLCLFRLASEETLGARESQ